MISAEIRTFVEDILGLRFCDECNGVIQEGYTNTEGEICICKTCFENYMNATYGQDCWRQTDDDGCDGYYEYLENGTWHGTGLFWTEWELSGTREQKELTKI